MPGRLSALLASGDSPVVGPETARQLADFAETPEPPLVSREQVDVMISKLAIATAQPKTSQAEARERLDLYWIALNDIPVGDLREAFAQLIRSSKFLPTPAEVRAIAAKAGAVRKYLKSRARHLAWKHQQEWRPACEYLTDLAGITPDLSADRGG